MMNRNETNVYNKCGIGFIGLLQIVFIVLKLCGIISWNWWIVMLPLIIGAGLWLLVFIFILILAFIASRFY